MHHLLLAGLAVGTGLLILVLPSADKRWLFSLGPRGRVLMKLGKTVSGEDFQSLGAVLSQVKDNEA